MPASGFIKPATTKQNIPFPISAGLGEEANFHDGGKWFLPSIS